MKRLVPVLMIVSVLFLGCDSLDDKVTIKYEATGTAARVNLTYENSSGNTEQRSNVPLPWSLEFTAHIDDFVYVSDQNQGATGTVTVKIRSEGKVIEEAISAGAYVIATASGSAK